MSPSAADRSAVAAVLAAIDAGNTPQMSLLRTAVRTLLVTLRERAPGRSVEMRVPPYGAIQCVEGPKHSRGIPPNVVETDPIAFVLLATGRITWVDALQQGRLTASGVRADLSSYLPCWAPRSCGDEPTEA